MAVVINPLTSTDTLLEPHQDIIATLSTSSHSFLQPTTALHTAAVLAAKSFLDPLASSLSKAQEVRKRESRKKRKRSNYKTDAPGAILQVREVYTEGFGIDQIWEQAKRILDAATEEVERNLKNIHSPATGADGIEGKPSETTNGIKTVRFAEDGFEVGSEIDEDDLDGIAGDGVYGNVYLEHGGFSQDEQDEEAQDDEDNCEDDIEDAQDSEEISEMEKRPQTCVPDPNKLNDSFFSIDDFNKQSQFLEQHDAMGEEDNPSDEDEIDWDANPLTTLLPSTSGLQKLEAEEDTDGEGGERPTLGNADLNARSEDEGDNLDLEDNMPGLDNTNDIQYADFFEAPPQKPSKSKRMRALPKTQPPPLPAADTKAHSEIDNDIQRAISDVRRDLLDSEDEPSSSDHDEDQLTKPSSTTTIATLKNLSTHEKQRAKIATEIRRLEAIAISKRDWTLGGEARAADRPLNSLIEEDLEFERAGKPIPVITAEVSEEIEALIKRRIVAREFDEVVRRRPEALGSAAASARRGRVELDDTKPGQGLADVYEAEHLKATDPGYVDKRSVALKKQHDEIARLWKDVSAHLDVLSNLHFKPKRVEVSVQVLTDKPTIRMEDARPGAGEGSGGRGVESALAPQEIYMPGEEGKAKGEVMGNGGMARSKEEMTREEKLRRWRREKERAKKQRGSEAVVAQQQRGLPLSKRGRNAHKAQEKKKILDELRKGGVRVIGKRGDLEEIDGKRRKGKGEAEARSTAYKL